MCFSAAGRRVGSLAVNLIRLVIAFVLLTGLCWLWRGEPLPTDASGSAWLWLSLSGVAGFLIGDLCLFRAFVVVGPRISSLLMSLAPVLTAIAGWLILGEGLSAMDALGGLVVLAGITLALISGPSSRHVPAKTSIWGVALGFAGALGQAVGLVLSKLGMGDYDPFAATQIRVITGIVGFSLLFFALRWWQTTFRAIRNPRAMAWTAVGATFGPFLGVSLSLVAIQRANTAVAASIMATTPVLILPIVALRGERVGWGGFFGALIAVAGVVILFLL